MTTDLDIETLLKYTRSNTIQCNWFLVKTANSAIFQYQPCCRVRFIKTKSADLADATLFGTLNDDTNLGSGKYYLTENNLPWGINLPTSFDYPVEGKEILDVYTHFGQWAQSRGFSFMDWYANRSGYRNTSSIYSR